MNWKLNTLIISALLVASEGFAQDSSGVARVCTIGRDWGRITDIAVRGEIAFLATDYSGLRLVDVSNPQAPIETGYWNTERGTTLRSVAVNEDIAVATQFGAVRIFDVADPEHPALLSTFENHNLDDMPGVALAGSYAYIAAADSGLLILDLSDPRQPSLHSRIQFAGSVEDVIYDRNRLYVGSGDTLRLFDASDPGDIAQETAVRTNYDIQKITVSGNLIYLSFGNHAMSAYDLAFPVRFHLIGSVQWLWAHDVAAVGNYGYAVQSTEITVVEIQRLVEVTVHSDYELPLAPRCAAIAGNLLLVGEQSVGLLVIDISNRTNPMLTGHRFNSPSSPTGLALSDYLYIADDDGMLIVDVSNLAEPEKLSFNFSVSPWRVYGVAVNGEYAYMACGNAGVKVLNKSDAVNPSEVGVFRFGSVSDIVIKDSYAYPYGNGVIAVANIDQPEVPILAGSIETGLDIRDVEMSGEVAVVSGKENGLHLIDFSNPGQPRRIGIFQTPDVANDVALLNDLAFVAGGEAGVRVVNISDPSHPAEVGSFEEGLTVASNIAVEDSIVYLVDDWAGLRIIDFRDLDHPFEIGHFHQQFNLFLSSNILVSDGYAYISRESTVEIYDCREALGVSSDPVESPGSFLFSLFPNPFNSQTTISFTLPTPSPVRLALYNPMGQMVYINTTTFRPSGTHQIILDAEGLPGGTYFVRLQSGKHVIGRSVTLLK